MHRTRPLAVAALALAALSACTCGGPGVNQPPTVRIVAPVEGAVLQGQGPHALSGQVTDPEEVVPEASIVWSSDRDGVLSFGQSVAAMLTPGVHRLSLDAMDSRGAQGRAQVSVTVVLAPAGDNPPTAFIDTPSNGAFFDQGQPITLRGRASDPEDGALTGAALAWTSSVAGPLGTGEQLSFTNAALGAHRLVLTATDRTGRSGYAAVDVTVVPPGTNRPPTVAIQAPVDGATLTLGQQVTLQGTATDPEDGALSGAALAWTSSRDGALGTGSPTSAALTQGVHVLTLTARDSLGATATASVTVSVNAANNQPPVVTITSPATGGTVFEGATVTLAGTATDPEDGPLSGAALAWTSSRDGALGTGSPLAMAALTAGDHTLTLTARDSGGNTATASVLLRVLPQNQPPAVAITAPSSGTTVDSGTSVAFSGTATDPEDGALTGARLSWRSSLDGVLGTGSPFSTAALSVGAHTITLTATDSGGRSASASIALTVRQAPVNVPPVARLTGPTTGQATQALAFDGATSSDADGTVVTWAFDFGDGTPPVSGAAAQASHAFAAAGAYTVTLTVTDNQGATGQATLPVQVTPFVRVPEVADDTAESHGGVCSLAVVGTTLHVAWYSSRHPTVWYATWANGTLAREVVDALGFNVGGATQPNLSLALDAAGRPHVAYVRGGQVWYATKAGGLWARERVDTAATPFSGSSSYPASLALDPSQAYRPTVSYPYTAVVNFTSYTRAAVAVRTGAGAWTVATPVYGTHTTAYAQYLRGDVLYDAAGTLYLPVYAYGSPSTADADYLVTWTPTATAFKSLSGGGLPGLSAATSLAWSGAGRLFMLSGTGLLDVALASPLSATTARHSYVEVSGTGQHAVAATAAGAPRLVVNHGATLESVWPDTRSFWERADLGATDPGRIDAAVDAAGETRACFFRAGKLVLY